MIRESRWAHYTTVRACLAVFVGTAVTASCRDQRILRGDTPDVGGPTVASLDSVSIQDSPHHFVGHPTQLIVDSTSGKFLIGDAFGKRVLEFSSQGTFIREFGGLSDRRGRLLSLYDVVRSSDRLLAVDERHRELSIFSTTSGEFLGRKTFRATQADFSPGPGNFLWAGGLDTARKSLLSKWDLDSDTWTTVVPISDEVENVVALRKSWLVFATYWADTMLVSLGPSNTILLMKENGTLLDSIVIPVRRRRGVPAALVARKNVTGVELSNGISITLSMHRLPNKNIALVYLENSDDSAEADRTTRLWLTLVSPDFKRACADLLIPATSVGMPFPAFRADTLFVFTQNVTADVGRSVIKKFAIRDDGCSWLPTRLPLRGTTRANSSAHLLANERR